MPAVGVRDVDPAFRRANHLNMASSGRITADREVWWLGRWSDLAHRQTSQSATIHQQSGLYSLYMKRLIGFGAILFVSAAAFGQLVCIGDACSCDHEKTPPPNLSIAKLTHVRGTLVEETTGLPLIAENTIVQVRTVGEKSVVVMAVVDSQGHFDLGMIPAGQYRLIAARRLPNGNLERQLADQPKPMECSGESDCAVSAIQRIHGTDLPFEFCPPQ